MPVARGVLLKEDAVLANKLQRVGTAYLMLSYREALRSCNCSGCRSLFSGSDGLCDSFALHCVWNSVFGLHALNFGHWRRGRWRVRCWRHEDLKLAAPGSPRSWSEVQPTTRVIL